MMQEFFFFPFQNFAVERSLHVLLSFKDASLLRARKHICQGPPPPSWLSLSDDMPWTLSPSVSITSTSSTNSPLWFRIRSRLTVSPFPFSRRRNYQKLWSPFDTWAAKPKPIISWGLQYLTDHPYQLNGNENWPISNF